MDSPFIIQRELLMDVRVENGPKQAEERSDGFQTAEDQRTRPEQTTRDTGTWGHRDTARTPRQRDTDTGTQGQRNTTTQAVGPPATGAQ